MDWDKLIEVALVASAIFAVYLMGWTVNWFYSRRRRPGEPLYCPVCHSPGKMDEVRRKREDEGAPR